MVAFFSRSTGLSVGECALYLRPSARKDALLDHLQREVFSGWYWSVASEGDQAELVVDKIFNRMVSWRGTNGAGQ